VPGGRRRAPNRPGAHYLPAGLAAELVASAGVRAGELAVDLGAGWGALTAPLVRRGARVLAVEADPRLAARLRRRFSGADGVTVVEGDALAVPLPRRPYLVMASIPFAITTALLDRLLGAPGTAVERADLVVEFGAARRFTARRPGDPRLLWWAARFELQLARRIRPDRFSPPPAVDAAVLRVRRRRRPLVPPRDQRAFRALLAAGLARPERPAVAALGAMFTRRQLARLAADLGIDLELPAADLTAEQWAGINAALVRLVEPARWPRGGWDDDSQPQPLPSRSRPNGSGGPGLSERRRWLRR
jgi:23S rRNA (adenine-N6)-dimethyltransferase